MESYLVVMKMGKSEMTTHERIKRMYEHREADRAPIFEILWNATLQRWRREGMPDKVSIIVLAVISISLSLTCSKQELTC